MKPASVATAAIAQPSPQALSLSRSWTARGIGTIEHLLESVRVPARTQAVVDGVAAANFAVQTVLEQLSAFCAEVALNRR